MYSDNGEFPNVFEFFFSNSDRKKIHVVGDPLIFWDVYGDETMDNENVELKKEDPKDSANFGKI